MDTIKDMLKPEIIWIVIGIIMLILEFGLPGLIIFFFGLGALVTGFLCLFFNLSLNAQLIIFILTSVITLLTLRKWLKKIFYGRISSQKNGDIDSDEFVGEEAVVTEKIIAGHKGKVEFHGTSWQATADQAIPKGTTVVVVSKNNITLIVKPVK